MNTSQNKIQKNTYFMKLALEQAKINLGNTNGNPSVGCVIVKDNTVIAVGSTSIGGRPHAECNAVRFSKRDLRKSTLYVTLEPCSHFGKTSPCTNLIIKKKIKKVFYSIPDYDLRSKNKCYNIFKKKNILTHRGLCKKEINYFYRSYIKSKTTIFPYLTAKLAISKDFYTINKKNEWITNSFSRSRVNYIRSNFDCIMTSSKTIIKDDSRLTCRIEGLYNRSPARIVLDNKLKTPLRSNIVKQSKKFRTIIFHNTENPKKIKLLRQLNIKSFKIPLNSHGNLDLQKVLIKAKKLGFSRILLETGLKLTSSFLRNKLIDDFKLFISYKKLGKNGGGSLKKIYKVYFSNKKKKYEKINLFGDKLINFKFN